MRIKPDDVVVVERVVNLLPLPPVLHDAKRLEQPQVMGDGRQAHLHDFRDVADAKLLQGEEVQDPGASLVAQHFEQLGKPGDLEQPLSERALGFRRRRIEYVAAVRFGTGLGSIA